MKGDGEMKDFKIIIRKIFQLYCEGLLLLMGAPFIVLKYYFGFKKIFGSSIWSKEAQKFYKGLSEKQQEELNKAIF